MNTNIFKGFQIAGLFAVIFILASCQDQPGVEPTDQVALSDEDAIIYARQSVVDIEEDASLGRRGCFEIVFPVTINFPDNSSTEVSSYEELVEAIRTWRLENPDVDGRPKIALPFDVITKSGEIITIESYEMLRRLKKRCFRPDRPFDRFRCFRIVFPVTLVFPDGSTLEVGNEHEMRAAIREWKENNPATDVPITFEFPIEIKYKNGEIVTVESGEQLFRLKKKCKRDGHPGDGDRPGDGDFGACFQIVFPVTLVFPDGTTAEVTGPHELRLTIKEWKENNPNSDGRVMLEFPLTVEFRDGTTQEVQNGEELRDLKLECR
jgi:hypothetical protein